MRHNDAFLACKTARLRSQIPAEVQIARPVDGPRRPICCRGSERQSLLGSCSWNTPRFLVPTTSDAALFACRSPLPVCVGPGELAAMDSYLGIAFPISPTTSPLALQRPPNPFSVPFGTRADTARALVSKRL